MDLNEARQELDDKIGNIQKAINYWTEKLTFHTMRGHKTAREDAEVSLQGNKDLLAQLLAEKKEAKYNGTSDLNNDVLTTNETNNEVGGKQQKVAKGKTGMKKQLKTNLGQNYY